MSHRIDKGGVIFGSIAIGGHQNAERIAGTPFEPRWVSKLSCGARRNLVERSTRSNASIHSRESTRHRDTRPRPL